MVNLIRMNRSLVLLVIVVAVSCLLVVGSETGFATESSIVDVNRLLSDEFEFVTNFIETEVESENGESAMIQNPQTKSTHHEAAVGATPRTRVSTATHQEQPPKPTLKDLEAALADDFTESGMQAKFEIFKAKRKRPYKSPATEAQAYRTFKKNRLKVHELNKKHSRSNQPGKKLFSSTGKYADIEEEDFKRQYRTVRPRSDPGPQPTAVPSKTLLQHPVSSSSSSSSHPHSLKTSLAKDATSTTKKTTEKKSNSRSLKSRATNPSALQPTLLETETNINAEAAFGVEAELESQLEVELLTNLKVDVGVGECAAIGGTLSASPDEGLRALVARLGWTAGVWYGRGDQYDSVTQKWLFCALQLSVADSQQRCSLRGGQCQADTSDQTGAADPCTSGGGHWFLGGAGYCPTIGTQDNRCCITKPTKCSIEANGIQVIAPTGLRQCAAMMHWPAAGYNSSYVEKTTDGITKNCCIPKNYDNVVKQCESVGGSCMPDSSGDVNDPCSQKGGHFIPYSDGVCPDGAGGPPTAKGNRCCIVDGPVTYEVDYRVDTGKTTPIKDQAQCGSCWAHSATETGESAQLWAGKQAVILSPQAIMDCRPWETTPVTDSCSGGFHEDAFNYWQQNKGVALSDYPYLAKDHGIHTCDKLPPGTGGLIKSWGYATPKCSGPCPTADENAILLALKNYGPLALYVDATPFQHYYHGIIPASSCSTNSKDLDHGVQLVGYGQEGGKKFWLIRNSWGADWGEKGYVRVEFGANACGLGNRPSFVIATP